MVDGVITGERGRLRLLQASTFTSKYEPPWALVASTCRHVS
jgi:hypothetical protein